MGIAPGVTRALLILKNCDPNGVQFPLFFYSIDQPASRVGCSAALDCTRRVCELPKLKPGGTLPRIASGRSRLPDRACVMVRQALRGWRQAFGGNRGEDTFFSHDKPIALVEQIIAADL